MPVEAFRVGDLSQVGAALIGEVSRAYGESQPMPTAAGMPHAIPDEGCGMEGLPALWKMIQEQSTHLASPWMSGHMDTAPHPAAALTQALVASLNNNLLFRELSPFASAIEERMVAFFIERLGLGGEWQGLFASGGSVANLTALFAAVGGLAAVEGRDRFHLLMPESGHLSLRKSARVLGISDVRIHRVACDEAGRIEVEALEKELAELERDARPIVTSVLGTTIHGSVDAVPAVGAVCRRYGAWHHVDAIYGGALGLSRAHRHLLAGLDEADSIVLGPQKWMYVPRVSAVVLVRGRDVFDERLGSALPYSLGGLEHRGRWGIQGSRPADAVVLWATLQVTGTRALGDLMDRSIELTRAFYERLQASELTTPTHEPDLNLQVFRVGPADPDGERLKRLQARLAEAGRTWMSVSRWRSETLMRAVLLSPMLTHEHVVGFVRDIEGLAS